jgi:subtilisin family serine protease
MKRFLLIISLLLILTIISQYIACSKQKDKSVNEFAYVAADVPDVPVINIERHPRADDYTAIFGKHNELPAKNDFGYDIRSMDLSGSDLTKEYDKLINASFDSKTIWPDKMPKDFNPEDIMELYKNPGLNIRSLHEKGITGKGIGIGIIDQPLLVDHVEYKDRIKYYSERDSVSYQPAAMHGAAVASIAVGKSVGVAPDADLYYIADDFYRINDDYSLLAESINELLDLNKELPKENRIRVISISWGYDSVEATGSDKLKEAYARAKEEGVLVITTSLCMREDMEFFGLDKLPLSDPDNALSYTKNLYGFDGKKYNISVPMNYRCTASPTGTEDYVVYREGGKSWATPYVAALYALACQVKPDITYEEFWKLASDTSITSKDVYNGESYKADYVVDPVAIINALIEN